MSDHGRLTRRGFVVGGMGAILAGCSPSPRTPTPPSASAPGTTSEPGHPSSPAPTADAQPVPPPPVDVPPYEVLAGEVEPECKAAATLALHAALTWRDGSTDLAATAARLGELGSPGDSVSTLPPLLGEADWSSLQVTYPQYGGLVKDLTTASVMINGTQLVPAGEEVVERPVTVDVRLVQQAAGWQATEILLAPTPAPAPSVSPVASALLTNERVVMPEAARADLLAGMVDDLVVTMLAALSEQWVLTVQVFSTGHPFTVFGTDRQSNHTRGRAVDVWAIDEVPVIDQATAAWRAVMEAAAALGSDEIGGPVDLDGVLGRRPYFSDQVHQDHLHLGFEPEPPD